MQRINGVIEIVQEGRFVLEDDEGGKRLFVLAHDAPHNPEHLREAQRSRIRVTVECEEIASQVAAVARSIAPADGGDDAGRFATTGVARAILGALRDWSLPRQLIGQSARSEAARSAESRRLEPRLTAADTVGTSICPYCAVGCAQLVYAKDGKVIHVEGDPRSPVNQGTLCPKGAATLDLLNSPLRLSRVLYRRPGGTDWEEKPLDWAMARITQLVRRTRDETFVAHLPNGTEVNHTLGIGALGGATLDNEENYLIKKLFGGGLGMVWIENQARI